MNTLDWAPPRPAAPAQPTASHPSSSSPPPPPPAADPAANPLSTPAGELALLRALVHHRLVGPNRHWHMLAVLVGPNLRPFPNLSASDVWQKYAELYDTDALDTVWNQQQQQHLEDARAAAGDDDVSPSPSLSSNTSTSSRSHSHDPVTDALFPRRDFSLSLSLRSLPSSSTSSTTTDVAAAADAAPAPALSVDLSPLSRTAFERGQLAPDAPRESPVPDDAPLRDVSVPLLPGDDDDDDDDHAAEAGGARGTRKRGAAAAAAPASPRKKARGSERR
ncbi:hypothetical protein JCM3775_003235 [Rhodotorula graminis]